MALRTLDDAVNRPETIKKGDMWPGPTGDKYYVALKDHPLKTDKPGTSFREASTEELSEAMASKGQPASEKTGPSQEGNIVDALNQALTMGYSDEIIGLLEAPFRAESISDLPGAYGRVRDRERGQARAFQERSPLTSGGATLAGTLPYGLLGGARNLATRGAQAIGEAAPQGINKIKGLLSDVLQRPNMGPAAFGGTAGLGYSEANTPVGQLRDVGAGTVLGGGLSRGMNYLGRGPTPLPGSGAPPASTKAQQQIARAIKRDEDTPAKVAARLRKMPQEATMADTGGPNLAGLAEAVVQQPGRGQAMGTRLFNRRRQGAPGRVDSIITRLMGGKEYRTVRDQLKEQKKTQAAPFYDEAYAQPVRATPTIEAMQKTPLMKQAFKDAEDMMRNDGAITGSTIKFYDYVGRALRNKMGVLQRQGANEEYRIVKNARDRFLQEVDRQVPALKEARRLYAGDSRAEEVLEMGRKVFSGKRAEYRDMVESLSPSEKEFFRLGVMEEVVERIMKKPEGGDIVKGIFNNPEYRARIRMVFDDPREYAQFERALRSEGQMFETGAQALRNSRTFGRQAAAADLDSNIAVDALDIASTATTGRGGGAFVVAKLGNWLKNWEQKKGGEKVRDEIARVMFKGSKAEQEALLMRLEAMGQYLGQRGGPSRILPTRGVPGSVPTRPGVNPYVGGLLGVQATNDAPSLLGAPSN